MLSVVMPLVNAATASAAETQQTMPASLPSTCSARESRPSRAAQVLISDRRPVEALPALRGLVIIASRFEQMTDENGPGIGIVLRMALDMPDQIGAAAETAACTASSSSAAPQPLASRSPAIPLADDSADLREPHGRDAAREGVINGSVRSNMAPPQAPRR